MRVHVVPVVIAACVAPIIGLAQAPSSQPTFKAGTTLVEVSAVVTRDGRPVTDLRADEVTLLDNGVAQPLAEFAFVDTRTLDGPQARRDFVLVVDDLHIQPRHMPQAKLAARAVIDALEPHDRLAVMTTARDDQTLDFTTDRQTAIGALAAVQAFGPPTAAFEAEHRARTAMAILRAVASNMRSDAGERRSFVLVSEGHAMPFAEARLDDYRLAWVEYLAVLREAALSNVAIYAIDPRGLRTGGMTAATPSRDVMMRPADVSSGFASTLTPSVALDSLVSGTQSLSAHFGSLGTLTVNTGGLLTTARNNLAADVPRMLEDSRQYYRLAYVQPDPRPGRTQPASRRIEVKVSRQDVHVRARQRYAPK